MQIQGRYCPTLGALYGDPLAGLAPRPTKMIIKPKAKDPKHVAYGVIEIEFFPNKDGERILDFRLLLPHKAECEKIVLETSDLERPKYFGIQRVSVLIIANMPFKVIHRGTALPSEGIFSNSIEMLPEWENLEPLHAHGIRTGYLEALGETSNPILQET